MPCYDPLRAWRSWSRTDKGKRGLTFNKNDGDPSESIDIPCGKCTGCRLEYARQWAIRCMHEAKMHEENCFVTLTYNDENIPPNWSLRKKDMQKFFKRLRSYLHYHNKGQTVRYYYAGEYSPEELRPHYHACIFGYYPPDRRFLKYGGKGDKLYKSETLENIWGLGFCSFGDVTFESAGYCARYIMKKVTVPRKCKKCDELEEGKFCKECEKARRHYERVDPETGEIYSVKSEYADMSRNPGIGSDWIDLYKKETYIHDSIIVNNREVLPPRYYDGKLSETELEVIKRNRLQRALHNPEERTMARLRVRQTVKEAAVSQLPRGESKWS